jgi:peptidoglycan/LPS O-acetylase OafA/YrhL
LLDSIGSWLTSGSGYDGRYHEIYLSGPSGPDGVDHSLATFLGNLAFLQTIRVLPFGSNGPMWSLANEFWYYIVFPLAAWLVLAKMIIVRKLIWLVVLIAAVITLPFWLLASGVVWLAGAAAAWCTRRQALAGVLTNKATRLGAVTILFGTLGWSRIVADDMSDLELGIVVAGVLPVFAKMPSPAGMYRTVARALSEVSYTLYLTHFPLLTFIVLTGMAPSRLAPSIAASEIYAVLISAAIILAIVFWWCFERNTDRIYSLIVDAISTKASAGSKPGKKLVYRHFKE